jgi:8-oxo-dGTP pyrophosphatase MutT (NUDIX family)
MSGARHDQIGDEIADRASALLDMPWNSLVPFPLNGGHGEASMGKARKQYGAVPYRIRAGSVEVLLVTSRQTKRWIVPKGWPKKTPRHTAKSEAYEESGVRGKLRRRALGSFEYRKKMTRGRKVKCLLKLFPLAVRKQAKSWPEQQERQTRWFKLNEATSRCSDAGLARLLRKFGSE